jgi:hypothetical protein
MIQLPDDPYSTFELMTSRLGCDRGELRGALNQLGQTKTGPTDEEETEDCRRNWIQTISEKDLKTLFIIAPLSFDSCHLAPADV